MTDWVALEKCIQKAEENGYECRIPAEGRIISEDGYICGGSFDGDAIHYYQLIFDYEFATAFFITTQIEKVVKGKGISEMVQHHLQQIVVIADKIGYLKQFIK